MSLSSYPNNDNISRSIKKSLYSEDFSTEQSLESRPQSLLIVRSLGFAIIFSVIRLIIVSSQHGLSLLRQYSGTLLIRPPMALFYLMTRLMYFMAWILRY
jgi:hypothetical protein